MAEARTTKKPFAEFDRLWEEMRNDPKTRDSIEEIEDQVEVARFMWLKKINPEELQYIAVVAEECPLEQKEVESVITASLLRSRIEPKNRDVFLTAADTNLYVSVHCLPLQYQRFVYVVRVDFRSESTAIGEFSPEENGELLQGVGYFFDDGGAFDSIGLGAGASIREVIDTNIDMALQCTSESTFRGTSRPRSG